MKKTLFYILILIILVGVLSPTALLLAADPTPTGSDYAVLAPLPGIGENGAKTSLSSYLPAIFNLAIGIAAVLAFVMITFGGIMYATSDAITGKAQGREYLENAIWGLLLVIGAWVILNTINPKILDFKLTLTTPNVASNTSPGLSGGDTSNRCAPACYVRCCRKNDITMSWLCACNEHNRRFTRPKLSSLSRSGCRHGPKF